MFALIKDGQFVRQIPEDSRFEIDGNPVMPALVGWSQDDYSLHKIHPAEPIPEGKIVTNTTVELVNDLWSYVHTLEDVPVPTPEELRAQMPDKTPREFRDILIDEGILTDDDPDEVTQAIQQVPFDKERIKALNAWQYMVTAQRSDPYIDMIGALFDLSPEDIDLLWMQDNENNS